MKTLLSLLIVCASLGSFALSPTALRPLNEHMVEVNAAWIHHPCETVAVRFETERQRIQTHLLLVHQALSEHPTSHLEVHARNERMRLLDTLLTYANRAVFPINTGHLDRTPYFIDHAGTACAVGYLVIASGQEPLAREIQQSHNFSYLAEMPRGPIQSWADEHGFTFEELEWIQPGYPYYPKLRFLPVDSSLHAPVYAVEYFAHGNVLCLVGAQSMKASRSFACYQNGTPVYTQYGLNLNGDARDVCMIADDAFAVVGDFTTNAGGRGLALLQPGGDQFLDIGVAYSANAVCRTDSSTVFDAYTGTSTLVMEWVDGESTPNELMWIDGKVNAIEWFDNALLVGGDFQLAYTAEDSIQQPHFLRWEAGQLYGMGNPFSLEVNMIREIGGSVYLAGECDSSQAGSSCIQRWNGTSWESVISASAVTRMAELTSGQMWFSDVIMYNDTLVAAGNFMFSENAFFDYEIAQNLVQISQTGEVLPYGWFENVTHSLEVDAGGELIVGGAFEHHTYHHQHGYPQHYSTFEMPFAARAAHDLLGIDAHPSGGTLTVYPVPSDRQLHVQGTESIARWQVIDQLGRVVMQTDELGMAQWSFETSHLSPGMYWIHAKTFDGSEERTSFVVAR